MALPALSPAASLAFSHILTGGGRNGRVKHTLPIGVQLADHDIRRMTDGGTTHTGDVATQETHSGLLQFTIALLWYSELLVYLGYHRFKRRKLNHRIGNLSSPQGRDSLIQTTIPLFAHHLTPPFSQARSERRQRRLHSHLYGLEGTECEISKELRRRARAEIDDRFIHIREEPVAVNVFENFVEAIFTAALEGVADEGWRPSEEDAAKTFFRGDGAPGGDIGGVDLGIDLSTAFDLRSSSA